MKFFLSSANHTISKAKKIKLMKQIGVYTWQLFALFVVLNKTLSPLDLIDTCPAFIGICCFLIVEIFGNGNLQVMMIYERFAVDPQKRIIICLLLLSLGLKLALTVWLVLLHLL